MTLADFVSKRNSSHPDGLFRQSSLNDVTPKKHHKSNQSNKQQGSPKGKKLRTSVLDLLHIDQAAGRLKQNNIPHQRQENSSRCRSSIIKSSDIQPGALKKSVTFASVFDSIDNKDNLTDDLEAIIDAKLASEEDLVTVIAHDRTTVNTNENIEPYPFRSEIPAALTPSFNSPPDVSHTVTCKQPKKKILPHFIRHQRVKKLRHPIQTIDPPTTTKRSISPHSSIISASSVGDKAIITTDPRTSSKPSRKRFTLSTIARLVQSFSKHSEKKSKNDTVNTKTHPPRQSAELRALSEFLY